MTDWQQRKRRWNDYKQGIRDKANGKEPQKTNKSYMEGYNETRPYKIAKYLNG